MPNSLGGIFDPDFDYDFTGRVTVSGLLNLTGRAEGDFGGLLRASVTLPDAQIKALPSASVVLVPAQPGRVIVPVTGRFLLNTTAGAYSTQPGASVALAYGLTTSTLASSPIRMRPALQAAGVVFGQLPLPLMRVGSGVFADYVIAQTPPDLTAFAGQDLALRDAFGAIANYTGGHPSNSLRLWVTYLTVEV